MTPFDFFCDLANPHLAFLPRALAMALLSAAVCAVVGCHMVLRGMAFIADAVSHAVFPGVAVAFLVGGSVLFGGAIAGVIAAVLITLLGQTRLLKEDSAIGVVFVAAFALGLVVLSRAPGYTGSLESFLFGSISGISSEEIPWNLAAGAVIVSLTLLLTRPFSVVALDRESARALGLPVLALDIALNVLVTLAIVLSLHIVGNILVVALLIAPPAAARLLTDSLPKMLLLAPLLGGLASFAGLWAAWTWDLPVGASIVLAATAVFILARVLAPKHGTLTGLLRGLRRRRDSRPGQQRGLRRSAAAAGTAAVVVGLMVSGGIPRASAQAAPAELTAQQSGQEQPARRELRNLHVDATHLHWDASRGLRLDTIVGQNTLTPADDVLLDLQPQQHEGFDVSKIRVPEPKPGQDLTFLGKPGSVYWNAPQGLYGDWKPVWVGVGAGGIPADRADLEDLKIELIRVDGPSWVEVYQTTSTRVERAFSSRDPKHRAYTVEEHSHGHFNWTFGAPGRYVLHFQGRSTHPVTGKPIVSNISAVHWQVGPRSAGSSVPAVGPESSRFVTKSTTPTPPAGPSPSPAVSVPSVPSPSAPSTSPPAPAPSGPTGSTAPAGSAAGVCARPRLSRGHIDLAVKDEGQGLKAVLIDETRGPGVHRAPESVAIEVNSSLKSSIPAGFGGIGAAGQTMWIIPQIQQSSGIWAGFNTERVDYRRLSSSVSISLARVKGPAGSYVTLFQEDLLTGLRVAWDSRRVPHGSLVLSAPSHVHQSMAFSRPGTYRMTVRYSAVTSSGQRVSSDADYTFLVGPVSCGSASAPKQGDSAPAPAGPVGTDTVAPSGPLLGSDPALAPQQSAAGQLSSAPGAASAQGASLPGSSSAPGFSSGPDFAAGPSMPAAGGTPGGDGSGSDSVGEPLSADAAGAEIPAGETADAAAGDEAGAESGAQPFTGQVGAVSKNGSSGQDRSWATSWNEFWSADRALIVGASALFLAALGYWGLTARKPRA